MNRSNLRSNDDLAHSRFILESIDVISRMGIERLEDFVVLFLSSLHHRQDTTAHAEVEAGVEMEGKMLFHRR